MKQDLKERETSLEECREKIIQLKEGNKALKEAMGDSQSLKTIPEDPEDQELPELKQMA